jgi:zinc/manganese transport system substrate-binding protein
MKMKKTIQSVFAVVLLLAAASPARAALHVLATIPELADMTERIGGKNVVLDGSLARGTEDIHQVVMRPSFVTKLNRADAVIYLGLTVEHSFLPGLLDAAVNTKMRTDPIRECVGPGCIDVSEGVAILEKPETLSRSEGELHPYGNPHYNLGPQNGPQIARNIAKGLGRLDPDHAADYQKNLDAYLKELDGKLAEWKKLVAPLKGMKAVSYHKDVAYLAKFTGLDFIDTVELKPGVAPTPTHLEALVKEMKAQNVKVLVREQHFEAKTPQWLAEQTGAKIGVIGVMSNSMPGTKTWVELMDKNLRDVVEAAGSAKGGS